MSKCSKKCNEIKTLIDSVSGLDDGYVYFNLLKLERYAAKMVNEVKKYADGDELNGTCFKGKEINF